MPPDTNGWSKAEMYVQAKLDEHTEAIREIQTLVAKIDKRLAVLWVKVGVIMTIGTIVGTVVAKAWAG